MDMTLWQIRLHETLLPATERDGRTATRYRARFREEIEPQRAARLIGTRHICGDAFTAADCVIGHNVRWAQHYGMCGDDVFRRYMDTLAA
jgi:glutathione S-transferase